METVLNISLKTKSVITLLRLIVISTQRQRASIRSKRTIRIDVDETARALVGLNYRGSQGECRWRGMATPTHQAELAVPFTRPRTCSQQRHTEWICSPARDL